METNPTAIVTALAAMLPLALLSSLAGADPVAARPLAASQTQDRLGVTLRLRLEHAPFPAAGAPHRDPSVYVFVPRGVKLRAARTLDMLVHLHGQQASAGWALRVMRLRQQVHASGRNVVLVVPQGPVRARDNGWGKLARAGGLRRMLREVLARLTDKQLTRRFPALAKLAKARPGRVLLSVHSGGYVAAARCLERGGIGVHEVYLFDALFGRGRAFAAWQRGQPGRRLVTFYSRAAVRRQHQRLRKRLDRLGRAYQHRAGVGALDPKLLRGHGLVLVGSTLGHYGVVYKERYLERCLRTSGLAPR